MRRLQIADCRLQIVRTRHARAVVLLEVVLALTLLVGTVATVGAAMNSCSEAAVRLRIRTRAADMAVTLLSEVQLGLIDAVTTVEKTYDDEALADWVWCIDTEEVEDIVGLIRLRVTTTHSPTGLSHSLGCLLATGARDDTAIEIEAGMEDMDL